MTQYSLILLVQGVSRSLTCLLMVVSLKVFPLLEASLHLSGAFYLYCGVVLAGLPLVMWILPETKDVPISQINNMFIRSDNKQYLWQSSG